jgi:hypothetical protein
MAKFLDPENEILVSDDYGKFYCYNKTHNPDFGEAGEVEEFICYPLVIADVDLEFDIARRNYNVEIRILRKKLKWEDLSLF